MKYKDYYSDSNCTFKFRLDFISVAVSVYWM